MNKVIEILARYGETVIRRKLEAYYRKCMELHELYSNDLWGLIGALPEISPELAELLESEGNG